MSKQFAITTAAVGACLAAATYFAGYHFYVQKAQQNETQEELTHLIENIEERGDFLPLSQDEMPSVVYVQEDTSQTQPIVTKKYVKNAQPVVLDPTKDKVVIVIDDVGVTEHGAVDSLTLPKEVVLSFLPYGQYTKDYAFQARALGHEIMIHLPMEPMPAKDGSIRANPGPNALYINDPVDIIQSKVQQNLAYLSGLSVGVNNHMGSRFTAYKDGMRTVLEMVATEKLFFMDSLTTAKSAVAAAAKGLKMPLLTRDVFLDHSQDEHSVQQSLEKLEKIAHKKGTAIAIGHPHVVTINAINAWAPTLAQKNIQLIPITALIQE